MSLMKHLTTDQLVSISETCKTNPNRGMIGEFKAFLVGMRVDAELLKRKIDSFHSRINEFEKRIADFEGEDDGKMSTLREQRISGSH